jgi:hypothetical protein
MGKGYRKLMKGFRLGEVGVLGVRLYFACNKGGGIPLELSKTIILTLEGSLA